MSGGGRRSPARQATLPLFEHVTRRAQPEKIIVPTERHAARLARAGLTAETRASLRARLLAELAPSAVLAEPDEVRVLLTRELKELATRETRLAPLLRAGGASWARTVASFDDALGRLRASGTTAEALRRAERGAGVEGWKARALATVMRGLDAALAEIGKLDPRCAGAALASALRGADPDRVASTAGGARLRARWILVWDAADVAWWRALDAVLSRAGGFARVSLPAVERPLDPDRPRDAFEIVADELGRALQEPPELEPITETSPTVTEIRGCADARAQARATLASVAEALRDRRAVEAIAVVPCGFGEEVVGPIARAFESARLPLDLARAPGTGLDANVLRHAFELLEAAADEDVEPRTRREHVARAREILAPVEPRLGALARRALAHGDASDAVARSDLRAAGRDSSAWDALERALARAERLARLVEEDRLALSAFVPELAWLVERAWEEPRGRRAGAVRVARAGELAAEPLELLVVVDANEEAATWSPSPDAFLGDDLVAELARLDPLAAPPGVALKRAQEIGALLLAMTQARRVVLAYRERGDDGSPRVPAPLVDALLRAGAPRSAWSSAPQAGRPTDAREARVQRLLLRPREAAKLAPVPARKAAVERAREGFFFDPLRKQSALVGALEVDRHISEVLTAETGGADRPLAVTRLESFAVCAFRGYAEQILGARAKRLPTDIPDALEEGTTVHAALAAAFERTREEWPRRPRDRERILRDGLAAAAAALSAEGEPTGLRRLAVERALGAVAAVLERALADEAWDFSLAEQPFGESAPGAWPALRVAPDLALRGKLDRVDRRRSGSAVRVLDYKRRAHTIQKAASGVGEISLQLPLYALAARASLGADEVSAEYLPFAPRDLVDYRPSASLEAKLSELVRGDPAPVAATVVDLVSETRRGALAPLPWDERACAHCEVDGGCRKPRFAIEPDEEGE
jgi:RecB family exonuclease